MTDLRQAVFLTGRSLCWARVLSQCAKDILHRNICWHLLRCPVCRKQRWLYFILWWEKGAAEVFTEDHRESENKSSEKTRACESERPAPCIWYVSGKRRKWLGSLYKYFSGEPPLLRRISVWGEAVPRWSTYTGSLIIFSVFPKHIKYMAQVFLIRKPEFFQNSCFLIRDGLRWRLQRHLFPIIIWNTAISASDRQDSAANASRYSCAVYPSHIVIILSPSRDFCQSKRQPDANLSI